MIEAARLSDARPVAQIHLSAIKTGFLSSLGIGFLKSLYEYLIKKEIVLVLRENSQVVGFVSCSLNSERVMKRFILYPAGVFSFLTSIMKKPSLLVAAFETLRIPHKNKSAGGKKPGPELPVIELLSIAVDTGIQQSGIGSSLLNELEKILRGKGVREYKVVAGANLTSANSFYQKNGFHLAAELTIHGKDISNVYYKSLV